MHWVDTISNKVIDRKMRLRTLEMDKRRLEHYEKHSGMSSLMESPTVKRLSKLKRGVLDETKNTEIQRSNRILLEKITHIFSGKSDYSNEPRVRRFSENELRRNKERIATENSQMNHRLRAVNSEYTFESPRPDKIGKSNNTPIRFRDSSARKYMVRPRKRKSSNSFNNQIVIQPCTDKKNVLYKGVKVFDGKQYLVQATIQNGKFVFRAEQKVGDLVKYMYMEEEDYRHLRKQYLPNGISSLFQYIRIGNVIEVQGLDRNMQTSTILELPSREVDSKAVAHRYQ